MNPLQRMLLAFVAALLKGQQPQTCKLAEITEPTHQWSFASNMTCDADMVTGDKGNVIDAVANGVSCTFTYSCPLDPSGPHRSTSMTCELGKWKGMMPDCSNNERIFDDILRSFGNEHQEEKKEGKEENKSVLESAIRKSSTAHQKRQRVKRLCQTQNMCHLVDREAGCRTLRVKHGNRYIPRLNQMFQYLCSYCFKYVCSRGVQLL